MKPLIFSLFLTLAFFESGCVSVNLGPGKTGKANEVKFTEPDGAFRRVNNASADRAWQSHKTGNTISFFSECPESEGSLQSISDDFLTVLKDSHVTGRTSDFFNGRESLDLQAEGKIDGIDMKVSTLVFKRNGCSYLLSYVSRQDRFETEHQQYLGFLKSFRAP
ncbi:MAG: hypothetical protein C5B49_10890 [Bdellovibrio sp.]|nr:MAG: hypothetical protein C5B49_10890 [Bdellovibrio sp.]